jgi:2-hydroxycyclohexanecarboxyl-CoA dehydrogenase
MRGLKGKKAIVTGGGSGIGRAICQRLGEEGCVVGIFDINADAASETAGLINDAGGTAYAHTVDITDYDMVKAGVDAFEAAVGGTDVLVNNAGWDKVVPFLTADRDLWKKVIDINLYGPLNMHYAVLPGMVERRNGRVINIASDAGRVGSSGEAVYSACKGGIASFSKTLSRELVRHNILLNTVCPGPTDTALLADVTSGEAGKRIIDAMTKAVPMRRIGQPEDYPGIVAFLASDDASFIVGQTISVSGGLTMAG